MDYLFSLISSCTQHFSHSMCPRCYVFRAVIWPPVYLALGPNDMPPTTHNDQFIRSLVRICVPISPLSVWSLSSCSKSCSVHNLFTHPQTHRAQAKAQLSHSAINIPISLQRPILSRWSSSPELTTDWLLQIAMQLIIIIKVNPQLQRPLTRTRETVYLATRAVHSNALNAPHVQRRVR